MSTREILQEALSLPVEERVQIADSLLRSLNTPISAIDEQWLEVAVRRLQEIRSGKVEPIAGDRVFAEILERFLSMTYLFHPEAKQELMDGIEYYES